MKVLKKIVYVPFEKTIKRKFKKNIITPSNVVISNKKEIEKVFFVIRLIWMPFWFLFLISFSVFIINLINGIF